jgi:integrase
MGSVYKPTYKDRDGKKKKRRKWYIAYTDHNDERQVEPAYTDKLASQKLLQRRETEAARRKAGLLVADEADRKRPIADCIEQFGRELVSRGSEPDGPHVKEAKRILACIAEACGWSTIGDIRQDRFTSYLADQAEAGRAPLTRNQHLAFLRNFCNWLVSQKWLPESPVASLKPARVGQAGRRRARRALTRDELSRLLAKAPEPRRSLYLIAALSGFRRKELRLIEKQDLDPTGTRPLWQVRATVAKNRRLDRIPIVPDLLPTLRPLWERLPAPSSRLIRDGLGLTVPRNEVLQADLRAAGIEPVDAEGRHADFHALRYTFCRLMGEVLPIQKVKVLMRHSTIKLTADLYTQLGIDDLGDEVWSLPPVLAAPKQKKPVPRAKKAR